MIKKADRDAILELAQRSRVNYGDALLLGDALIKLVNTLPVEEENLTKPRGDAPQDGTASGMHETPASPGAALIEGKCQPDNRCLACERRGSHLEPAPASAELDFAAMAGKFTDDLSRAMAKTPDLVMQPFVENWLRANAHRFAAPAPAVVRDEAWWTETMLKLWASIGDGVDAFERVLRARFAAAPAFDVETLISRAETIWRDRSMSWRDAVRAVARDMGLGKGGA
jgi:hypothetical protein